MKITLTLRDTKKDPPADDEEVLGFYIYPTDGDCFLVLNNKGESIKRQNAKFYVPMSEVQKEISK